MKRKNKLDRLVDQMSDDQKLVAFSYLHGMAKETIDEMFLERFEDAIAYGMKRGKK